MSVSMDKVLLEHSHAYSFTSCLGCSHTVLSPARDCSGDQVMGQGERIYYLALYRIHLPTPVGTGQDERM